jgi:hypothetical protein
MTTNHTISDILEQQGLFPESPLVFYQGGFELSTVDKLLAEIEVLSLNEKFVNRLKKKVFRVGVEVLQNLFHYFDNNELT